MNKQIIFIGITPYPNGLASTNRLVALFSNLASIGWQVNVICAASTKFPTKFSNNNPIFERKGQHRGVNFRYISAIVSANKPKIVRLISGLWGLFLVPFYLFKNKYETSSNLLLINSTRAHYVIYLKILATLLGFKLVLVGYEYPRPIRDPSPLMILYKIVLEKWIFKSFDGFILMTNALEQYFCKLKNNKALTKLIPMSVDLSRFDIIPEKLFNFQYIAYAGSLSSQKDGLDVLLSAFNKVAASDAEIRLVIIGDISNRQQYQALQSIIQFFPTDVVNRIIFTGRIDRSLVPHYLMNAKILALARPNSVQAQGGFPTKLGEYLATGRPVVVTKTGEISLFLSHRQNALLCEPGDIDDFAANLSWALENYDSACLIASKGRYLAETVFNAQVQARELSVFLKHLQ